MQHHYPFGWLDSTITHTLNPEKADIFSITSAEVDAFMVRIQEENTQMQSLIKNQVFATNDQSQLELLIRQYHSSLTLLLDCALKNEKHDAFKSDKLKALNKELLSCLNELLCFVERWFSVHLSLEERVPAIYLCISKRELRKKMNKIRPRLIEFSNGNDLFLMLIERLDNFTDLKKQHNQVTFRDVLYQKELIRLLEMLDTKPCNGMLEYSALDELLIYLNFNSKEYINRFTQKVADKINASEDLAECIEQLLLHYKVFNQMHRKPDVIFNPNYHSLDTVLGNWFKQEIIFLEKKMHLSITPLHAKSEAPRSKVTPQKAIPKIMCILSTDQIALILRAAGDLKVVLAKSMNEVFRSIVPYLSTPYKEDLSYDAMRSKAYVAEERDKEIAIETLEHMIKQIKEY